MIQEYMNYLRNIRGLSENTIIAYGKDLHAFVEWAKRNKKEARWSNITMDDVDKYITNLAINGLSAATTNRKLSAISGIYSFFRHKGMAVENPCRWESRRKIAERIPNTIDENQLLDAYKYANGIARIALGLFMSTGIRIQELLDMTWESINFEQNSIRIKGKGRKERMVYTTADKLETLKATYEMSHPKGTIFKMEQRQMRTLIFNALKPYCRAKQLSPHAIRHTFATHAANQGANVTTLATALGHKNIETTQKYIDLRTAPTRDLMTSYNIFN